MTDPLKHTMPDCRYKIQAVYIGMVSYTDWIFGQLLDGLASCDVVFLGEHHNNVSFHVALVGR